MWKYESYTEERGSERAKAIGENMRNDRKAARYTIRQLAELIDVSPTHLNRMEKGDRLMDSIAKLIRFCDVCQVPVEKYLVLCGLDYPNNESLIRRAFPMIKTDEQEKAISTFAEVITAGYLSNDNITQILNNAMAYAAYCQKQQELQTSGT